LSDSRPETYPQVVRQNVEELPPRTRKIPLTASEGAPAQPAPGASTGDIIIAAFSALGYALSARAILMMAILGAFVLALKAMDNQTMASLYVFVAWAIGAVLPATILEIRKRGN
jgi:hypothetical protein